MLAQARVCKNLTEDIFLQDQSYVLEGGAEVMDSTRGNACRNNHLEISLHVASLPISYRGSVFASRLCTK